MRDEDIIRAYELGRKDRKRNLPYRFYGLTEYGVELLYEYKYLRGVPIMRAITDATEKPEKVMRHQNAPRPPLPELVANASQYDEPRTDDIEIEDVSELEDRELIVEGVHRRNNRVNNRQEVEETEIDSTKTPKQDTTAFDGLF